MDVEAFSWDQTPPVELYVIKTIIIQFSYHFTFVFGRFMEKTKKKKNGKREGKEEKGKNESGKSRERGKAIKRDKDK